MPTATHVDVREGYEAWRNASEGLVTIKKFDGRGQFGKAREILRAGELLQITPEERRLNQEKMAADYLDPFQNGLLYPVRLLDNDPDSEWLRSNPNVVSDDDIAAIANGDYDAMVARLATITILRPLERIRDAAADTDSIRRVNAVDERIAQVTNAGRPETAEDSDDEDQRRNKGMGFDASSAQRL